MTYTVGQLARAFGLSRSTLLYYDRKGLLKPSARSSANYRRYSEADYSRLSKIMTYKSTGLSLSDINDLLKAENNNRKTRVLASQLDRLNQEIAQLRRQQQVIITMLGHKAISRAARSMNKDQWVKLLASIGLSENEMRQWHVEFEQRMPQAHQDFLEALNISKEEIKTIRQRSRDNWQ